VVVFSICYVLALNPPQSVLSLVLIAFGALVQLLPGVVAAFVWPRASWQGVVAGIVVGIGITVYFTFMASPPFGIHAGLLGFVVNLVLVTVGGLLNTTSNDEYIHEFIKIAETK